MVKLIKILFKHFRKRVKNKEVVQFILNDF